ncbi:MAG TPA: Hsp20/alpha crystallin family protein [Candidatus Eisenbacteria bacterium]|jgi:HSP20 family molecular chaperone IbpA|nr:Hsp20/alpha crystallin family protein [Candidatus Eisenbacteria bacterium]
MKRFGIPLAAFLLLASAASADQTTNVNYDQVREDYRTYLRELKRLGVEYNQFTGEMKKIMQEEGFPAWDEEKGVTVAAPGTPLTASVLSGAEARIEDRERDMRVSLDLPGLKKDSIKVKIQGDKFLHVTGKKKTEGANVERVVELPVAADQKGASATYEDGVLTVTVRKTAPSIQETDVPVR